MKIKIAIKTNNKETYSPMVNLLRQIGLFVVLKKGVKECEFYIIDLDEQKPYRDTPYPKPKNKKPMGRVLYHGQQDYQGIYLNLNYESEIIKIYSKEEKRVILMLANIVLNEITQAESPRGVGSTPTNSVKSQDLSA